MWRFKTARALGKRVRGRAQKVALSVDAGDALLDAIVDALHPDLLQLHGKETPARVAAVKQRFGLPVMKAIAVATKDDLAVVSAYAAVADRLLFDARAPREATRPGGLGKSFDWRLLENLDPGLPFVLSGGSTPAMSPRPCASRARRGSTFPRASSARRARRILIKSAPSCARPGGSSPRTANSGISTSTTLSVILRCGAASLKDERRLSPFEARLRRAPGRRSWAMPDRLDDDRAAA